MSGPEPEPTVHDRPHPHPSGEAANARPVAIVLAAGVVRDRQGRVEPAPEGRVRCWAALHDLRSGRLAAVYALGGRPVFGQPVAVCYVEYLRRFAGPRPVELLPGGTETGSDLAAGFAAL